MPDPEYTVKIVDGKAVYTQVAPKPKAPKVNKSLGCRARYNAYAKAQDRRRSKLGTGKGATIDYDTWAGINCQE